MWWRWTASSSGTATFDTVGSSFDTYLAVYTGGSLSALNLVAQDDDSGGNGTSLVTFSTVAGTTYYFAVTGFLDASGTIRLNWQSTAGPSTIVTSATASTYHVFPEFADGRLNDGSYYRTTLMIANPNRNSGVTCTLRLSGLTINGSSVFTFTMVTSGWVIYRTSGTQNFQSGYATLQCSAIVEAQLLYSFYSQTGTKISEATVFSSPPAALVQILADTREGARVGLAITNDSDQSVNYTVGAYDVNGNQVGTTSLTLSARSSRTAFLDQLVSIPSDHYGQVLVSSSNGTASIIGLRFTGGVFTTIPETIR